MGSIVGVRFCANTVLKSHTVMFSLRVMRNYYRHFSLNKEMCYSMSQQRCLQDLYYHNISNRSPYSCTKMDNRRHFSVTRILEKGKDRGKDKKKQKTQHIDFNEMEEVIDVSKLTSQLDKAIENLKDNFVKYVSVRSSMGALEELAVKFEGKNYTLQELAQISRKPKLVVLNISTFPQAIPDILKSLSKNQMNLNPQQDGTTVYIPIPKVTKEHRETLSKNAKSFYVKCCDNVRDVRSQYIKKLKQKEGLAKDLVFRVEGYIDILSHQYKSKAEQMLETKQKELLGESE
ncbi:PREDICTED: ribosome-recycling factor, mitochondrial [Dinoponera quadriceps]|uniref:Ribosome-recycling factor, mitochondrial n=1 Tax=Dinoponera quadriceps TaxID=609295 RepID=A0A6P3WYR9_DINQU|nr:PREDICTED: ribosome-recycling factor, mitochondrial [Dinoponera quadriceps]XP_014471268.1 PREDICTED: ribosome-recycling factor, mitochondrial [Dinoponera quadriceps]